LVGSKIIYIFYPVLLRLKISFRLL